MIAECEGKADRLGQNRSEADVNMNIMHCMGAQGYRWSPWIDDKSTQMCAHSFDESYREPACYHAESLISRWTDH